MSTIGLESSAKRPRAFVEPETPLKHQKLADSASDNEFQELEMKTTGGSMEDGEIADKDDSIMGENYQLYEYPGVYWMKDMAELGHSGVKIKTTFARNT